MLFLFICCQVACFVLVFFFFFFKQKTAYEIMPSLVGSEMCIRDSTWPARAPVRRPVASARRSVKRLVSERDPHPRRSPARTTSRQRVPTSTAVRGKPKQERWALRERPCAQAIRALPRARYPSRPRRCRARDGGTP